VRTTTPSLIRGSEAYPEPSEGPVVTIGNFDGVHKGHRKLLEFVQQLANSAGRPTAVYTFDPAPRDVLRPDNTISRIQSLEDKIAKLHSVGVDQVIVEPFSRSFANHEAKWFATEVIAKRLGASALIVGWDFHFGKNRAGNYDDLKKWLDISVHRFEAYTEDGKIVSSSQIRQAVQAGDMTLARTLLENPHEVVGHVVHGDGRGKTLGYPTANIKPVTNLIPANGVYAVQLERENGMVFNGVANIGTRPTFDLKERSIEVHLFNFEDDLYNEKVRIRWFDRIRGEVRFEGQDALVERIQLDSQIAQRIHEAVKS
jgi:riboflavin kinase/FMN adenylyltransferase